MYMTVAGREVTCFGKVPEGMSEPDSARQGIRRMAE